MIPEAETNFLYLSELLPLKFPSFSRRLLWALEENGNTYGLLPSTKDIWAVDYMPIQTEENCFIRFTYNPDYLRKEEKYRKTISPVDTICSEIGIVPHKTDIILDGGNVVRSKTKVIMTSKIFQENPHYSERGLIEAIERLLGLRLVIIPTEPEDWIGHADGLVRFLDEDSVLINDYSREKDHYSCELRMALQNAGLDYVAVPFNPYQNPDDTDATGIYINYLQMKGIIYLPVFGLPEDEQAVQQFEVLFKGQKIVPVYAREIAREGGILNCISWNIRKVE